MHKPSFQETVKARIALADPLTKRICLTTLLDMVAKGEMTKADLGKILKPPPPQKPENQTMIYEYETQEEEIEIAPAPEMEVEYRRSSPSSSQKDSQPTEKQSETSLPEAKSKNISSQEEKGSLRSNHSSLIAMAKEAALKMGSVQTPSGGWITPKK